MSINELFINQIYDSYKVLVASGSIPKIAEYSQESITEFESILNGEASSDTINRLLIWASDPIIKTRREYCYLKKEVLQLGYYTLEEMPPDLREKLMIMYQKNTNLNPEEDDEEYRKKLSHTISQKISTSNKAGGGDLAGNALFDKSKCCDVFNDVIVDDLNMYEQRSDRIKLQMKFKRMQMSSQLTKTKFMLGVGGLSDIWFI